MTDLDALTDSPFGPLSTELFGHPVDALSFILVNVSTQSLQLFDSGTALDRYSVSTASKGAGNRDNTGCTPLGWHTVSEKIGAEAALGSTFKGRVCGAVVTDLCSDSDEDMITSRILWLAGAQAGYNSGGSLDSKKRYIYIHGTAQEHLLGKPVSHGCIRMRNTDVIALFDKVVVGTPVLIAPSL